MSNDETSPEIPVVCSDCGTRTRVPFEEVENTVARHNEGIHDGEEIAEVDPDVLDRLAEFVAEDMDLL